LWAERARGALAGVSPFFLRGLTPEGSLQ
jgi:hypothetical protein